MEAKALLAPWLVRANSITNNFWLYQKRPQSWREYAESLLRNRETVATVLLRLKRSLSSYFEGSKARSLFGETLPENQWNEARIAAESTPNLPKSAVDEWGLSSETQRLSPAQAANHLSSNVASIASLFAQRPLSTSLRDYFFALEAFFGQGKLICATHGIFGRQTAKKAELQVIAESLGYDRNNVRLSKFNLFEAMRHLQRMQEAFDERCGNLVNAGKLAQIKRRECELFPGLWALWYQFCDHPEKRLLSAETQAVSELERARKGLLEALQEVLSGSETWQGVVLREDYPWEGQAALVLQLEIHFLDTFLEAQEQIFGGIEATLGGHDLAGLFAYTIEYYWGYVLIVPTIDNYVLGPGVWTLPRSTFASMSGKRLFDRNWLKILHPLTLEQIRELGLEVKGVGKIEGIEELKATAAELQVLFSHVLGFRELAAQLDQKGRDILGAYFNDVSPRVNALLAKFQRFVPEVCRGIEVCSSLEAGLQEEAVALLEGTSSALEQFTGENDLSMGFADCQHWAEEFQDRFATLTILSWIS